LPLAIRICKPLDIDGQPGGPVLVLTADPGAIAAAYQSATRARGLPIFYGDLLAMDTSTVEAFAAEIESMLAAMSGQVLIIEDVDGLPLDPIALQWAFLTFSASTWWPAIAGKPSWPHPCRFTGISP
jgi:hypothetical protein